MGDGKDTHYGGDFHGGTGPELSSSHPTAILASRAAVEGPRVAQLALAPLSISAPGQTLVGPYREMSG